MIVATSFTGTTARFIFPDCLCTASMIFSVPWPSAPGARYFTMRLLKKSATGRSRKYERKSAAWATLVPSSFRKTVVDMPTMMPTQDARSSHLRMLTNKTELSNTLLFTIFLYKCRLGQNIHVHYRFRLAYRIS